VWRCLTAVVALGVALSVAASPATPALERTIVPGVGIGGITLGATKAEVNARLGTPMSTGTSDMGLFDETRLWGPPIPLGGTQELDVTYAVTRTGATSGAAFISTPADWMIAGTGVVSHRHGDVAALWRAYGPRLKGPYSIPPPLGETGASQVYYELPGRYRGRRVHTLFRTVSLAKYADEVMWVTVSFCGSKAPEDPACHATR
jgi:hypothetical protein